MPLAMIMQQQIRKDVAVKCKLIGIMHCTCQPSEAKIQDAIAAFAIAACIVEISCEMGTSSMCT
jgi:hypothetical protein